MLQKRVLVVDDDEFWRAHVRGVANGLGYEVTEAPGAPEAAALLDAHPFDLLITDNWMGAYDAGIDLLARNEIKGRKIPSILHTTNLSRVQAGRLHAEAPDAVPVTKSTTLDTAELAAAIQTLLG